MCLHFGHDKPRQWLADCDEENWQIWQAYADLYPEFFGFQRIVKPPSIQEQLDALRPMFE